MIFRLMNAEKEQQNDRKSRTNKRYRKLKAERNRLLRQVEEAEQVGKYLHGIVLMPWLTIYKLQRKQAIAQNYWDSSRSAIELQFEFVLVKLLE